jgi:predicted amidohydrolase
MRVAIYQTDPVLLDVKTNLEDTIEKIAAAKARSADLVVFPELSLTGYFVRERYPEVALRMDATEIKQLAKATKGTAAVVGFIEESPAMNFYNSAMVAVDGEILFAYRKLNLPNYGVFEERKIFANGKHVREFKLKGLTIAPFICNDMWHPSLPYLGITQKANRVGCEVFEGLRAGDKLLETCPPAKDDNPYCFWGGSEIIDPFGQPIATAALFDPDSLIADISRDLVRKKRTALPYLRNDDPYFTHRELGRILYGKHPRT